MITVPIWLPFVVILSLVVVLAVALAVVCIRDKRELNEYVDDVVDDETKITKLPNPGIGAGR